jgi:hypothetical protein
MQIENASKGIEVFRVHASYQTLSKRDKKRMLSTLIRWGIKEWFKNF